MINSSHIQAEIKKYEGHVFIQYFDNQRIKGYYILVIILKIRRCETSKLEIKN